MSNVELSEEILRAVERSTWDPVFFARFFLREWFPLPMPWFHRGFLAMLTRRSRFLSEYEDGNELLLRHFRYLENPLDPSSALLPVFQRREDGLISMTLGPNNNTIWPRGFSKTTTARTADLWCSLHNPGEVCVYVSDTAGHAETQVGNIARQLENNPLLLAAYGEQASTHQDPGKWRDGEIHLKNGSVLVAKGRGSQVRGLNFDGKRPTRITVDDPEDLDSVGTDLQRQKTRDWFYGSVVPSGADMEALPDTNLRITVLGTILAHECLVTSLALDPTFNTIRFGAVLEDGSPLWPDKMSIAGFERRKAQFAAVGQLSSFYREYGSVIRVDEEAAFQLHNVRRYEVVVRSQLAQVSVAMDPAISGKVGRDHTAIVVSGRRMDGMLFVLDVDGGLGWKPRRQIDRFFELVLQWRPEISGIESVAYQAALIDLMREEMARRQFFFNLQPITQSSDVRKDDRILGILQPRYSNGYVRHRLPFPQLETQLLDFPLGKKDYVDAEAMSFRLLGETSGLVMPDIPGLASPLEADEYEDIDTICGPLQVAVESAYRTKMSRYGYRN